MQESSAVVNYICFCLSLNPKPLWQLAFKQFADLRPLRCRVPESGGELTLRLLFRPNPSAQRDSVDRNAYNRNFVLTATIPVSRVAPNP